MYVRIYVPLTLRRCLQVNHHMIQSWQSFSIYKNHKIKLINILLLQLSKLEKTVERREKQIKSLTGQLENARQEQEAAINKANQFRTSIDNMKLEFEENKKALVHVTKELKVFISWSTSPNSTPEVY